MEQSAAEIGASEDLLLLRETKEVLVVNPCLGEVRDINEKFYGLESDTGVRQVWFVANPTDVK